MTARVKVEVRVSVSECVISECESTNQMVRQVKVRVSVRAEVEVRVIVCVRAPTRWPIK